MLADRIEAKWIDAFCEIFERCAVKPGDTAAICLETQSTRAQHSSRRACFVTDGRQAISHRRANSRNREVVPVRSTGASIAIQKLGPSSAHCRRRASLSTAPSKG